MPILSVLLSGLTDKLLTASDPEETSNRYKQDGLCRDPASFPNINPVPAVVFTNIKSARGSLHTAAPCRQRVHSCSLKGPDFSARKASINP